MKHQFNNTFISWLLAGTSLLSPAIAHAWGYDGHRIAADVASSLLTQKARIRVGELLMGSSLADVASYMDEERRSLKYQIPGSDKWHFDNIPACGSKSVDPCPNGNCATARIDQFGKILADRKTDQATKTFAVKVLVHLIADIHQPLHTADDGDYGGNDVAVGRRNLHSEWDSGMVKMLIKRRSPSEYTSDLLSRYGRQIQDAEHDNAALWVAESHELAVRVAYGALPGFTCGKHNLTFDRLPGSYYEMALPIVESQLVKAGARIAFVLNNALGK